MNANERLYLELQLKVTIWKWKKDRKTKGSAQNEGMVLDEIKCLKEKLNELGNQYLNEVVCSGMGAYVLKEEKDRMFFELNQLVNHPSVKEKLRKALFQDSNLDKVVELSLELRKQVSELLTDYESRAQERRAS